MTAAVESVVSPTEPARESDVAILSRYQRREVTSAALFGGGSEIGIRHGDQVYTLRQTARGKLILTK